MLCMQGLLGSQQHWLSSSAAHTVALAQLAGAVLQLETSRAAPPAGADPQHAQQAASWQLYEGILQQMRGLHQAYLAAEGSIAAANGQLAAVQRQRAEALALMQAAQVGWHGRVWCLGFGEGHGSVVINALHKRMGVEWSTGFWAAAACSLRGASPVGPCHRPLRQCNCTSCVSRTLCTLLPLLLALQAREAEAEAQLGSVALPLIKATRQLGKSMQSLEAPLAQLPAQAAALRQAQQRAGTLCGTLRRAAQQAQRSTGGVGPWDVEQALHECQSASQQLGTAVGCLGQLPAAVAAVRQGLQEAQAGVLQKRGKGEAAARQTAADLVASLRPALEQLQPQVGGCLWGGLV